MNKRLSLDELRAELARQDVEFERAREVLVRADEDTFVACERVDELRAAIACSTPRAPAPANLIRM